MSLNSPSSSQPKLILHLDMNSYFATTAQQANPHLRGKPVGIIKAKGRGCVIAASVEAKRFGVKTGTTVWNAQKLCPAITLVPADMDQYFSLTERLMRITGEYSPVREIFSIDELFLDLTPVMNLYSIGPVGIAWEIKSRIREELGEWMSCSVGISFTKLLAKLASEMKKPDGLVWLDEHNFLEATEKTAIEEVCGIGYSRTKYLHSRGAYTLGQARLLPDLPLEIADLVWLRVDELLEKTEEIQAAKSVSRTFTTFREITIQEGIEQLIRNLVEEATAKLREMDMVGRTFGLSLSAQLEHEHFWTRTTVNSPTDDPLLIFNLLWSDYCQRPISGVRQAGVFISNLSFKVQIPLIQNRQNLLKAADCVNGKWGLFTIYPARLLGGELIRPEVTGYLGDKYYRFGNK